MNRSTEPATPGAAPSEIALGTPPSRTPETLPDTDLQPEQAPARHTPDVRSEPGGKRKAPNGRGLESDAGLA